MFTNTNDRVKSGEIMEINRDEGLDPVQDALVLELREENRKMMEEFNVQRAKLKDMFVQKEETVDYLTKENQQLTEQLLHVKRELDDAKSQLVVADLKLETSMEDEKRKANEEITTLQQLVQETLEESSTDRERYDSELKNHQEYIEKLEIRLQTQNQSPPNMFNTLTRKITQRLSTDQPFAQKSSEDEEDLNSLIEPLEDQIQALKTKLRQTDELLQKYKVCPQETNSMEPVSNPLKKCDMCSNYEDQLVKEQQLTAELKQKIQLAEKSVERHREDLLKEIGFRQEMEEKWNEKKEEHKQQVSTLTNTTEHLEKDLIDLQQLFTTTVHDIEQKLLNLTHSRGTIQQDLDRLQLENEQLMGKYAIHSQTLQSQVINLPDTVHELHELVLRHHQDLIIAKIAKETYEEQVNVFKSDLALLKDQFSTERHDWKRLENSLVREISSFEKEKRRKWDDEKQIANLKQELDTIQKDLDTKTDNFHVEKRSHEEQIVELKTRVSSLQQELDTSETVQKDFVRLSQSLQVQLEKIRECDTQVRWQHLEDVSKCSNCQLDFGKLLNLRRDHCRHCGQVFCENCLGHKVNSGPNLRPSVVCDVCHTLLVKSSAPYFSQTPPQSLI